MWKSLLTVSLLLGAGVAEADSKMCKATLAVPTSAPKDVIKRAKAIEDALCNDRGVDYYEWDLPDLNELEQFAYLSGCVNMGQRMDEEILSFVTWCSSDFAQWDDARAKKMLAKLGLDPRQTRIGGDWVENAPKWRAKLKELNDDAAWKKLLAAATKGAADWRAAVAANKELYDQARELRKAVDSDPDSAKGATVKALKLLEKALAKSKPKTLDEVLKALEDPVAYEAYQTALYSSAAEQLGGVAYVLVNQPPRWEGGMSPSDEFKPMPQRGPRVAGGAAIAGELLKLKKKDARFERTSSPVSLPSHEKQLEAFYRANPDGIDSFHAVRGTIAAMKPQKDGRILLTFKTETLVHDVGECTSTGKILRILPDGTVEYEQDCHVTGQEKERVTPKSVYVMKDLAAGLKPGRMISYFWKGPENAPAPGWIHAVWTDAKHKTIAGWAGMTW